MTKIDLTKRDKEVLRDAALMIVGGDSFSRGSKGMKTRTMKGLFEVSSGLRDLIRRIDEAELEEME